MISECSESHMKGYTTSGVVLFVWLLLSYKYKERGEPMVRINGNACDGMEGLSITEMLDRQGFAGIYVAVEINEEIIDREKFDSYAINDGDVVEIVRFVGGGQLRNS